MNGFNAERPAVCIRPSKAIRRAGLPAAAFGQMGELHPAPQHREHRFGDHAALAVPELRVGAEKAAGGCVGGAGQLQHVREQRFGLSNQKSM